MTMNITYLSKGSAGTVYADARGTKRFVTDDFPAFELISAHLNGFDLQHTAATLDDGITYGGTSMNPFLVEAFITSMKLGRFQMFSIDRLPADVTALTRIANRFELNLTKFVSLVESLNPFFRHLSVENLAYYAATVYMASTNPQRPDQLNITNRIVRAFKICNEHGVGVMPGHEQLMLLADAAATYRHESANMARQRGARLFAKDVTFDQKWQQIDQVLASLLMFTTADMRQIITEQPKENWLIPGRIKQAMGCKTYAEVKEIQQDMASTLIDGLLPTW